MGFYLRKSVNVGPLRFNLSKSGIGVSTGIRGFRVGSGPKGNYVQMGRGGVYFRQTLPTLDQPSVASPPLLPEEQPSRIDFQETELGNVPQLADSSSSALLDEISSKAKKPLIWPWVAVISALLVGALIVGKSPLWCYLIFCPLSIAGLLAAIHTDKLRKTVILVYALEPHIERAYERLHNAFESLRGCSRVWHIASQGDITTTYDWKTHAGADAIVKRKTVIPYCGAPPYLQCNVSIPALPGGRHRLYFLPDRILVWDSDGVGAVSFDEMQVVFGNQRFIESGVVPGDSAVVDKTWKYVNKKGGPDRRFSNNSEIPVALYEELRLISKSGLQELFQLSKTGVSSQVKAALQEMASAIASTDLPATDTDYVKCPCNNCDILIEFPIDGVGQTVKCPHCGMDTVLSQPSAPSI